MSNKRPREVDSVAEFSVGGRIFATKASTLRNGGAAFANLVLGDDVSTHNGMPFMDGDPDLFVDIMKYCRGTLSFELPTNKLKLLLAEATALHLDDLCAKVKPMVFS